VNAGGDGDGTQADDGWGSEEAAGAPKDAAASKSAPRNTARREEETAAAAVDAVTAQLATTRVCAPTKTGETAG
jgi:hypothetical protein